MLKIVETVSIYCGIGNNRGHDQVIRKGENMRIICLSNISTQGMSLVTTFLHCLGNASIHSPSWIRFCYGVSLLQVYRLASLEIHSTLFNPFRMACFWFYLEPD